MRQLVAPSMHDLHPISNAERAGRAWRKLFGANVPSERELRDAERETLANGRASERETSTFGGGTG